MIAAERNEKQHQLTTAGDDVQYCNTAFLIHKPLNVISSTKDPKVTQHYEHPKVENPNKAKGEEKKRARVFESRTTVYETAEKANFPTSFGLVGRLDYETSGLMLMTCDNGLASAIRDPVDKETEGDYQHCPDDDGGLSIIPYTHASEWIPPASFDLQWKEKEYVVKCLSPRVFHEDTEVLLEEMRQPLTFSRFHKQFECKSPTSLTLIRKYQDEQFSFNNARPFLGWCIDVRIVLREGKHHQIRRLCKRSKLKVISLTRVRMANILHLDSVPTPGQCRWLTVAEMDALYKGYGIDPAHRPLLTTERADAQDATCTEILTSEGSSASVVSTSSSFNPSVPASAIEGAYILNYIPRCIVHVTGLGPMHAANGRNGSHDYSDTGKNNTDAKRFVSADLNAEVIKQALLSLMNENHCYDISTVSSSDSSSCSDTNAAAVSNGTDCAVNDSNNNTRVTTVPPSSLRYVDCHNSNSNSNLGDGVVDCDGFYARVSLPAVATHLTAAVNRCTVARFRELTKTTAESCVDANADKIVPSSESLVSSTLRAEILTGEMERDYWRIVRRDSDSRKRPKLKPAVSTDMHAYTGAGAGAGTGTGAATPTDNTDRRNGIDITITDTNNNNNADNDDNDNNDVVVFKRSRTQ